MGLKDNRKGTPREVLVQDLISFVTQKQELNHQIVICGDFNKTFQPGTNTHELASQLGLIDVLHNIIGHK